MQKSSNRRPLLIVLVILAVLGLFFYAVMKARGPKDQADVFVQQIEKKDAVKSYALFSQAQKRTLTAQAWEQNLASITDSKGKNELKRRKSEATTAASRAIQYVYYDVTNASTKYVLTLSIEKSAETERIGSVYFTQANPTANNFKEATRSNEK